MENNTDRKPVYPIKSSDIFGFGERLIKETSETARTNCRTNEAYIRELMSSYKMADTIEEKTLLLNNADKEAERIHKDNQEYRKFVFMLVGCIFAYTLTVYEIKTYEPINRLNNLLRASA